MCRFVISYFKYITLTFVDIQVSDIVSDGARESLSFQSLKNYTT